MSEARSTPLRAAHEALAAHWVTFAGWRMPGFYSSVIEEHLAVRSAAGCFDVSHMGELLLEGTRAGELLQQLTCNDVSRLEPGRAHYNALMLPNGALLDDLIVYMLAPERYLLVVNAANTVRDLVWIRRHARAYAVRVEDLSASWALVAVQGPKAQAVLAPLTREPLQTLGSFHVREAQVAGVACLVARTGYTGEDGFEVFVPAARALEVWNAVLESGRPAGLRPAGLGARDTLRLEARLLLYGQDMDESTSLLEAGLGWLVQWGKGPFVGRGALERERATGPARKLVGFEMRSRAIARHGYAILRGGKIVGRVTSGSFAPFLKKNIGLAYLPRGMWEPGTRFEVEVRGRAEPAEVVPTPFYRRPPSAPA